MTSLATLELNGKTTTGMEVPAAVVEDAKTDETRERRVDKAMIALRERRKRP